MVYAPALSSSAFIAPAIFALRNANEQLATSTARLSSGNRLFRIGDDVAAFSVATRLQAQISGLKQAAQNTAQADSLLQVASGGLTQIRDILDSMTALATQSNSGGLTDTDRSFLQTQFAEYVEEIDRIAGNTSFGDLALLDGSFSGENTVTTETTAATKATGSLVLNTNFSNGETVVINGVTVTAGAGNDFTIGVDAAASLVNLAAFLNASTNRSLSGATYTPGGNTLSISYDAGGTLGNQFTLSEAGSADVTASGTATNNANIYTLTGGLDDGLNIGSVTSTGTIGDAVVNTQSQTASSVTLTFTGNAVDTETLRIDNGNGGYRDFTFKNSATLSTEIQIGSDAAATIRNAIDTLTQYSGSDDYVVRQLSFTRDGDRLIISNSKSGAVTDLAAATADIAETLTNASLSAASFNNGTATGVDASGVTNAAFVGTISGFSATRTGADAVTATLTVGEKLYTATISDTTPGVATTVRFNSTSGGFFDVQLAAGGFTVATPDNATTYAQHLNAAFATLTFSQNRDITEFSGAGSLVGASAKINLDDFTSVKIDSIVVTAPPGVGQDAVIDITVNGEIFRSASDIGGALGEHESLIFTSQDDANRFITLTNGGTAQDFDDATSAATFQTTLRTAFGLGTAGQGVDFQVGTNVSDKISVVIGNVTSAELFDGVTPDISTSDNAEDALDTLSTASDTLQSVLAEVGAYQSRLTAASAVIDSSITGITVARSALADTDIAAESTEYAQASLKINAAVAVIAQTAKLQSSLLQALQFSN
uniref:Flagellin n=1 Tax=uncultured bacterium CSL1 TaxID=1091565 RepID=G4WVB2_9BACT|nr:flagellin [uncultured bacterium CSL1]